MHITSGHASQPAASELPFGGCELYIGALRGAEQSYSRAGVQISGKLIILTPVTAMEESGEHRRES